MIATITEDEIRMTATDRLAQSIAFQAELTLLDCENIVDAGLADMSDFGPHEEDPTAFQYEGDRWTTDCGTGRPKLVECIDVPADGPGPDLRRVQNDFARMVLMLDGIGRPCSDELIERMRAQGWDGIFERAAKRDAAEAGRDRGTDAAHGDEGEDVTCDEEV